MIKKDSRHTLKDRRHRRLRKKVFGSSERPRFSVFRSEKQIYVQFIDDENSKTLASASSLLKEVKPSKASKKGESTAIPLQMAKAVGELAAKKALEKGITRVVFDRGGFKFHGRIKALADKAREAGLQF